MTWSAAPATDGNASPVTGPPGGKSAGSWLPSRPASCPRSCEHVTVTSSAPSSSKTGPSRRDADDSFTTDPQAMPPPPTAKPFRSTSRNRAVLPGPRTPLQRRVRSRLSPPNRLVPTTLWLMRVDCRRRGDLPGPGDHGDFDARPIPRIKPHCRTRARGGCEQQVAQVPGEHLHCGIFRSLPEPKAQVAFDVSQDPRPPGQAHRIDQPTVAGPTMIGGLEPGRDLPLGGAGLAAIRRGHQLQGEHLLLLAAEQREDAVRRQFSQRLTELEIVGELGAGLHLAGTNSRTEIAARPHFLAQASHQRGVFGETFNEDRAGAFKSGARINYPLTRFDIPASHLLRALVGSREKRLCQRLEARFACDLGFRSPLRPIRQIEILEPRLAILRFDPLLERGVEFSLLADAVEDSGPTLVQLAQIAQALLERAQLGIIERPGRLLPVAGNKGHGRSAVEQRDGGRDLLLADAEFLGDAQVDRLHRS